MRLMCTPCSPGRISYIAVAFVFLPRFLAWRNLEAKGVCTELERDVIFVIVASSLADLDLEGASGGEFACGLD